jgi:hypothetical protein
MLSKDTVKLNLTQRKELSKSLFNLGNFFFSTILLGKVVLHKLDTPLFLIGALSFTALYVLAIMLID